MCDRSMALPVHEQWIDTASDIIDAGVAHDLDLSGIRIYFNLADGTAVRKHRHVHLVIFHDSEPVLELLWQGVVGCVPRQLKKIERSIAARRPESAVPELDQVRRAIENDCGNALAVGHQVPCRHRHYGCAMR